MKRTRGYFTCRQIYIIDYISLVLTRMRNVQTNVVEKIATYILYSITFFLENRAFYEMFVVCLFVCLFVSLTLQPFCLYEG